MKNDPEELELFDIEIADRGNANTHQQLVPTHEAVVGMPVSGELEIYMDGKVYESIREFAASDTSRELGGVLLGGIHEKDHKSTLVIRGALEAKHTQSTRTTLTFTHETWDRIHLDREKMFPNEKIVGWFHTHPGFGIFLSSYDQFISNNFFNLPWQVAYVVDPVANTEGFFQWRDAKLHKCGGFYLYGVSKPAAAAQVTKLEPTNVLPTLVTEERSSWWWPALNVVGVLVISGLIYINLQQARQHAGASKAIEESYNQKIAVAQEEKNAIDKKYAEVQSMLQSLRESLQASSPTTFVIEYVVQPGDSLHRISRMFYGDSSKIDFIQQANQLTDPDLIQAGQILKIPLK